MRTIDKFVEVLDFKGRCSDTKPDELCFQLIESIQSIDTRISELNILRASLGDDLVSRQIIKERVEALLHTRFTLVYVFMDTVSDNKKSVFGTLNPNYKELSRHIHKMMVSDILVT